MPSVITNSDVRSDLVRPLREQSCPRKSGTRHHPNPNAKEPVGRVYRTRNDVARQVRIPVDREQGRDGRFAVRRIGDTVGEDPVSIGRRYTKGILLGRTLVRPR